MVNRFALNGGERIGPRAACLVCLALTKSSGGGAPMRESRMTAKMASWFALEFEQFYHALESAAWSLGN